MKAPFPGSSPLKKAECRAGGCLCPFCGTGGWPAAAGIEPTTSRSWSGHSTTRLRLRYGVHEWWVSIDADFSTLQFVTTNGSCHLMIEAQTYDSSGGSKHFNVDVLMCYSLSLQHKAASFLYFVVHETSPIFLPVAWCKDKASVTCSKNASLYNTVLPITRVHACHQPSTYCAAACCWQNTVPQGTLSAFLI